MGRLLGITLLLLFSLPLIAPLLAFAADPEASLPACCRRNGAHHCAASIQPMASAAHPASDDGTALAPRPEKCPAFPATLQPTQRTDLACNTAALCLAEIMSDPVLRGPNQARARVDLDRSCRKRGPPVNLS